MTLPPPSTCETPRIAAALKEWWYYTVELAPGVFTRGNYSHWYSSPRHALSQIDVRDLRCLDIGTMEGLIPVLWAKHGARQVVATDGWAASIGKIDLVKKCHDVAFDYHLLPPGVNAYDHFGGIEFSSALYSAPHAEGYKEFDLINLSGVLYHVWSPLHWLASFRPSLREGGLMVVSTHLIDTDQPVMEFNIGGSLQMEADTFWYISGSAFQYMLNLFGLKPIGIVGDHGNAKGKESMYASVVCRAISDDLPIAKSDDKWIGLFCNNSLELRTHYRKKAFKKPGFVKFGGLTSEKEEEISIADWVRNSTLPSQAERQKFTYTLKLNDKE